MALPAETSSLVLRFDAPPRRARQARSTARPRVLAASAAIAILPYAAARAALGEELFGFGTFLLALGAGTSLLVVLIGVLAALVERHLPRRLPFTSSGVVEDLIALRVEPTKELRSFRLYK